MSLKDSFQKTTVNARHPGLTLTDDVHQQWDAEKITEPSIGLLRVRPHTDSHDLKAGYRFAKELSTDLDSDKQTAGYERGRSRRLRHRYCWELWNADQKFQYVAGAADTDELTTDIRSRFPDATTAQFTPPTPARHSPLQSGRHLAGARITQKNGCRHPLGHFDSKGVRITDEDDPHRSIYGKMHSDDRDGLSLLQLVFEQVDENWFEKTESADWWTPYILRSESNNTAQKDIDAQKGQSAFRVAIRIFAIGDTRKQATERVRAMTGMFSDMNNPETGQKLVVDGGLLRGYDLQQEFVKAMKRTIPKQGWLNKKLNGPNSIMTDREIGMLLRFSGDLGVGQVDSSTIKDAGSVPTGQQDPEAFLKS